jgi:hypothetical protein
MPIYSVPNNCFAAALFHTFVIDWCASGLGRWSERRHTINPSRLFLFYFIFPARPVSQESIPPGSPVQLGPPYVDELTEAGARVYVERG